MARPLKPPPQAELMVGLIEESDAQRLGEKLVRLLEAGKSAGKRYRHWDSISSMKPPDGLTHREWWLGIKMARRSDYRHLPLLDAEGAPLIYALPDEALELLHFIDQHAAGEVLMTEVAIRDSAAKSQYMVNSLIEEAIRSSQLEGAVTSRADAKEMIRTGREPRDRSERMILNNYRALEFIREDAGDRLTADNVFALHRIVTDGTLDNPEAAGRLQRPSDQRIAVWGREGTLLYRPPPADQLPRRLQAMCKFANGEIGPDGFMHPVVRAILLHFWLAFDHPFEDGNGRTARALFYWSMRTQGYWATEYLSISKIIRSRPAKYRDSFLYTQTDEGDTTYFILDQLNVIHRAIEEFQEYLQRKMREIRDFDGVIRNTDGLNHRQLALLRNAVRNPSQRYTFYSHQLSHNVSFESARSDLKRLHEMGLLDRRRIGRRFVFSPSPDLAQLLTKP